MISSIPGIRLTFAPQRPVAAASDAGPESVGDQVQISPGQPAQVGPYARDARQVAVLIAGAGNAGLTAALYTARAQLDTLVIGSPYGSQLAQSADVENFPGFKRSTGFEVVEAQYKQAEEAGARFEDAQIVRIEGDKPPFRVHLDGGAVIECQVLILATGARARRLGIPGEQEFFGRGVSTCATCDGPFYKGKNVVVVGGGDTAVGDATVLAKVASSVTLVHRRGQLSAEKVLQERLEKLVDEGKVKLALNSEVLSVHGKTDGGVDSIEVAHHPQGSPAQKLAASGGDATAAGVDRSQLPTDGLFLAVGHLPNTDFLKDSSVQLNEHGHVVTHDFVSTSVPGILAAGDMTDVPYYQASVASGFGAIAGLKARELIEQG
jgi:thioredoxin reductase (NADPH)